MADLKISALNSLAGADLVAADVVAVVDDSASETKKLTVSDLIANGTTLISDATIPSAKILFSAGAIDTAELAASSVETAKINDSAVTAAKLADNSSVTLVSTLPASGDFTGQIALDTDDDKIYVWDGSAWDSVKGAGSINVVNGSTTGEINIVASTSGDTVTISATLDDTTAAAQFLAGPTGAGGTVGYRAIIGTDLPTASTTAKGGVIVNGNGLTMSSDTIAIDNTVTAETSENHIVQYDANGLVTGGRAIVAADVPNATSTTVGVIKPGSGLGVTAAGELNHDNSVTAGTASKVTFDTEGHITGTESLVAADIPDLDADKITTGTVPTARIASDAVTADKLADRSTATIAETTPAGGAFIGQCHLNSITGDYFLWDGNVWQPIGISVGEIVLAGTYDASTNLMATVTAEGTALSFVVGSALPAASSANKGYYVVVSTAGTGTSPAPTVALSPPDFLLSTGTTYTEIDVSATVTAQQAENVAFTAAGNIAATNVQAAIEELDSEKVAAASPSLTGTVSIGTGGTIEFEGATANDFETTLTVTDPTADRTITLPNVTGTVVTTGDTGSVTSTMITDGTIVNADISASAEIAVSKLANGTARQLLQTDVAGSGVEFTSNVDVPGTLDVTGAATLDSTLDVTGVISADGKVKFPAGSASAPSFYSGTDTNTGLYFSAADEISVATGGTQRVAVNSSGKVLIGTASAETFRANITPNLQIEGTDSNTGSLSLFTNANSSSGSFLVLGKSRSTAVNGDTVVQNGDGCGTIQWVAADGTDRASRVAKISAEIDGTPGSNDTPGRLIFSTTADGASTSSERLRIDSSGNVGIGTTSAASKVHVKGGSLTIEHNSPSTGTGQFNINSESNAQVTLSYDDEGHISIGTASAPSGQTGFSEKLRIDSSGNVGIGTTSPTDAKLVVSNSTNGVEAIRLNDTRATPTANKRTLDIRYTGANGRTASNTQLLFLYDNNASSTKPFMEVENASGSLFVIDSSGNVGIGTSSPSNPLVVKESSNVCIELLKSNDASILEIGEDGGTGARFNASTRAVFEIGGSEKLRIDSSGRLCLGTTSSNVLSTFALSSTNAYSSTGNISNDNVGLRLYNSNGTDGTGVNNYTGIQFNVGSGATSSGGLAYVRTADNQGAFVFNQRTGASSYAEAMRITSIGEVTNKTSGTISSVSTAGWTLGQQSAGGGYFAIKRDSAAPVFINRGTNDGELIAFYGQNTKEGNISVSGTTVSYNGAHLSRWSQLPSGAERTEILRGSVLSNLDEMCEWGEEDNEQLNRMKVSDIEGDRNVAGVFQAWDDDDDTYTNDFYCAMTGDFVIRIAQGTTVARGDLLMSAGDGTAKPQDDDIVRSKTIAKVTSTTVSETYSDGSYCVPCVLMAC